MKFTFTTITSQSGVCKGSYSVPLPAEQHKLVLSEAMQ